MKEKMETRYIKAAGKYVCWATFTHKGKDCGVMCDLVDTYGNDTDALQKDVKKALAQEVKQYKLGRYV